jgi:hypothetical protein
LFISSFRSAGVYMNRLRIKLRRVKPAIYGDVYNIPYFSKFATP